jgi:hypothetical protein
VSFNSPFIYGGIKVEVSMQSKRATTYVDYQERARGFAKGQRVFPYGEGNSSRSGVVLAVFPAIGMVDVQFPHGTTRLPVEELVIDTSKDYSSDPSKENSLPSGDRVVPVTSKTASAHRVANRHFEAMYWVAPDRTYRLCRGENPMTPSCPKCKGAMGTTVYKRRGGKSERLLVCPSCLFIIKHTDVIGG